MSSRFLEGIMHRAPAIALWLLLAGGPLSAQAILRIGGGLTRLDFTCRACEIDAQSGFLAFISASRPIGSGLTAGLEGTFADASFDGSGPDQPDVKLFGPMATVGLRRGARLPVWATVGFGWLWYSGVGPNSNGPAASLRAGVDAKLGSLGLLTPFAGYTTMLGHDGPEVATAISLSVRTSRLD
jgi:hypothetical protein